MSCQRIRTLWLVSALTLLCALAASGSLVVLDATFRGDRMYPEHHYFWNGRWTYGDPLPTYYQGGALCVYLYNNGTGSVTIDDMTINGQSLQTGIVGGGTGKCGVDICSVYYGNDKQALIDAGIPVWWRVDANPIPAGGSGEIFVRMRRKTAGTLSLSIVPGTGSAVPATVTIDSSEPPRVSGYSLSPDSTKLYLYLRHPVKGTAPTQILIDNVDKTSNCTIAAGDSGYDVTPVYCDLGSALTRGSYHTFQAVYAGGAKATVGVRVFYDDFKYGVWGGPEMDEAWFHNLERHSVNLQKGGQGGWARSGDGKAHMGAAGFKFLHDDLTTPDLYGIFLCDEPDASEHNINTTTYGGYQVALLAQGMSRLSQSYKTNNPQYPTNLNLDGSFKPLNYYNYGHVADVMSVDPYYQTRLVDSYWDYPKEKPIYVKATYIYAVANACQAAFEPQPVHMILNSCRKQQNDEDYNRVFRWGTPEEKRIEVYYSLAAGAKQIAYWWMQDVNVNQDAFAGIGYADEPGSAALWREMGLLGAEAGTVSPLIVNGCPVDIAISKPGKLWTRALISGTNTIVLFCVNDDYVCNDAGTIIRSVDNAEVSLDLPNWIGSPTNVFEVDYKGVRDVSHGIAEGRINLHLGAVDVTRMIVITSDSNLKSTLSSRYSSTYGPRVAQLIPLP